MKMVWKCFHLNHTQHMPRSSFPVGSKVEAVKQGGDFAGTRQQIIDECIGNARQIFNTLVVKFSILTHFILNTMDFSYKSHRGLIHTKEFIFGCRNVEIKVKKD